MSNSSEANKPTPPEHKPRPLVDMVVSIIIPTIILMKFSGDEALGATLGLVVALAFPLTWGLIERIKYGKNNFIALLGLISILLTGGIGLLEMDTFWLAVKEAAVPGIIGIAVLVSTKTRYPLIKTLLFNPKIMNLEKIKEKLDEKGNAELFENRILKATYFLSSTFFFSAVMNYFLARYVVTSPAGTTAFNEELGRLTLLSYPMIAIPSMIMMVAIFYYLWRSVNGLTGLKLEEVLNQEQEKTK